MNEMLIGILCGIGIPYIIIMVIVLRYWCCPTACICRAKRKQPNSTIELSPAAYRDFMRGNVTTQLYKEIMHLYSIKDNLNAYIRISERNNHKYMTEFLKNPTQHPHIVLINAMATGSRAPQQGTVDNDQPV